MLGLPFRGEPPEGWLGEYRTCQWPLVGRVVPFRRSGELLSRLGGHGGKGATPSPTSPNWSESREK